MTALNFGHELGCLSEDPLTRADTAYARYLSRLLNTPPRTPERHNGAAKTGTRHVTTGEQELDLLLYWPRERPWWQKLLGLAPACHVVEGAHASVLVVPEPRWPLRRVLLVLRAHEADEAAMRWLGRLVRPTRAELFILPIIPPEPAMYRFGSLPLQAEVVLAPNTYSGAQLRRLAALCSDWGIESTVLLHDREPHQRITWAASTNDCDLILLSAEPYDWMHRHLLGELVRPLLRSCRWPVLVARNRS